MDWTFVLEGMVYAITVALFSFVIVATARMRHEFLLVVCIPPVFVAIVMGFVMAIYAWDNFGLPLAIAALLLPTPIAWRLGRLYTSRDLLICIYLAWAIAMVCALVAFQFPDLEEAAAMWPAGGHIHADILFRAWLEFDGAAYRVA